MPARPKYSRQDKAAYIALCREYNRLSQDVEDNGRGFLVVSLQLHAAKALVPKKWGTESFVRSCGT